MSEEVNPETIKTTRQGGYGAVRTGRGGQAPLYLICLPHARDRITALAIQDPNQQERPQLGGYLQPREEAAILEEAKGVRQEEAEDIQLRRS